MSVSTDYRYIAHLLDLGLLGERFLELGSYNRQQMPLGNARTTIEGRGLSWQGTDIEAGPDVDFTLDMLDADAVAAIRERWDTVLVMNLLEHVYDPIRVLESALTLVKPGGQLVIVGPVVWALHDYPRDYWRPLPDFYLEFAQRHGCDVPAAGMRYIVFDELHDVLSMSRDGQKMMPSLHNAAMIFGRRRALWSRFVHRAANTFGREMFFPFVGLGVCLQTPSGG